MEKTLKLGDIIGLGAYLAQNEDLMDGMKLNARAIYSILKLKKAIIERFNTAQETVLELAKNYGAEPINEGQGIQVPPEKLEDFNKDYADLMRENVALPYDAIEISASSECSAKFMEAFFDFILITD